MLSKKFIKEIQTIINDLYFYEEISRVSIELIKGTKYYDDYIDVWVHGYELIHCSIKNKETAEIFIKTIKEKWKLK